MHCCWRSAVLTSVVGINQFLFIEIVDSKVSYFYFNINKMFPVQVKIKKNADIQKTDQLLIGIYTVN